MAERIVTDWATAAKGRALWVVGGREFKVQTIRSATEVVLTDTNDALTTPIAVGGNRTAPRSPAGARVPTAPAPAAASAAGRVG